MSKRSEFPRRKHDAYATPYEAVPPLLAHLKPLTSYCEPCAGEGDLIRHLGKHMHFAVAEYDIQRGQDALQLQYGDMNGAECIISNTPWSRHLLHPMIERFVQLVPYVWLLFDGDWLFTKQAAPYIHTYLTDVVPTPRLKWIPDSKHTAKDNTAWFRFEYKPDRPARFWARGEKPND